MRIVQVETIPFNNEKFHVLTETPHKLIDLNNIESLERFIACLQGKLEKLKLENEAKHIIDNSGYHVTSNVLPNIPSAQPPFKFF